MIASASGKFNKTCPSHTLQIGNIIINERKIFGRIFFFLRSWGRNVPISRLSGNFVQKNDENGQKKLFSLQINISVMA